MNPYTQAWADMWCQHEVTLNTPGGRTASGPTPGTSTPIMADVNVGTRLVLNRNAQETSVAATVSWPPTGPTPTYGDTITLPDQFGLPGPREIVTITVQHSGNGLTPDHKEVTLK